MRGQQRPLNKTHNTQTHKPKIQKQNHSWRKELTWRCFLVSAITIVVVRVAVSACVSRGHCTFLQWGSLIWFQQAYPTPYEQVWAFVLLAVVGGYVGSLFTSFNTWVCLVRKRWSGWFSFRVLEVCVLSVITSTVFFALPLAGHCHACDTQDPTHCVKGAFVCLYCVCVFCHLCVCLCCEVFRRILKTKQTPTPTTQKQRKTNKPPNKKSAGSTMFRTFQGYRCHEGTYNDLAVLSFNPQGFTIQALFVAPPGTFRVESLLLYR